MCQCGGGLIFGCYIDVVLSGVALVCRWRIRLCSCLSGPFLSASRVRTQPGVSYSQWLLPSDERAVVGQVDGGILLSQELARYLER